MYELFAMNDNGVEILVSKSMQHKSVMSTMATIIESGMTPIACRTRTTSGLRSAINRYL